MSLSAFYVIIIDVIFRTTAPATLAALCNSATDRYFYEATAVADSAYVFSWPAVSGAYVRTRIVVGNAQCMLEYDAAEQKVAMLGPCGNTDANAFSIQEKKLLYQKDGFSFEIQCFYEENSPLKVKVLSKNATAIQAFK